MRKLVLAAVSCSLILTVSCVSEKKKLARMPAPDTIARAAIINRATDNVLSPYQNVNFQLDLFKNGTNFYGYNKGSKWEIQIKGDSSIYFKYDGEQIIFSSAKVAEGQDKIAVRYTSKALASNLSEPGLKKSITVIIKDEKYLDEQEGLYVPLSVRIEIEDHTNKAIAIYAGGGFYVPAPVIHDIWVLDSIKNMKISSDSFPLGAPRLEFHLDGGKIYGFSGCNEIAATFYTIQNQIQMNSEISTLKSCPDVPMESMFMAALANKRYYYSFENTRLTLKQRDGSVLIFKKAD